MANNIILLLLIMGCTSALIMGCTSALILGCSSAFWGKDVLSWVGSLLPSWPSGVDETKKLLATDLPRAGRVNINYWLTGEIDGNECAMNVWMTNFRPANYKSAVSCKISHQEVLVCGPMWREESEVFLDKFFSQTPVEAMEKAYEFFGLPEDASVARINEKFKMFRDWDRDNGPKYNYHLHLNMEIIRIHRGNVVTAVDVPTLAWP
jgi:hypothetical protein